MPIVNEKSIRPQLSDKAAALRILIVDDQNIVRGMVRSALEKQDRPFAVIEASSGEEASAIMQHVRVDVIFCDVQLPGISGPEALATAYAGDAPRPFMVLMSAAKSSTILEIGQRLGVYEFMPKPFRAADVLNAINAYDRLQTVTRVLLVDDSGTARKIIGRILRKSQFMIDLHEADSGESAIQMGRNANFDVIFLDFNMPGLNGADTAAQLLLSNPAAQIVLMSTEQQAGMVRSAQHVGAFAFIKKPFEASDVDAVLHDAFAIKRPSLAKPTHAIFSNEAGDAPRANAARGGR